jgi:hypothetical protein
LLYADALWRLSVRLKLLSELAEVISSDLESDCMSGIGKQNEFEMWQCFALRGPKRLYGTTH